MNKIVIVEDDELLLDVLQKKLKQDGGYDVSVARNIEDGKSKIVEIKPDLILLDAILAKKSSLGILEEIRHDPVLAILPVIVIINSDQPTEVEHALEMGATDCLIKTKFDPNDVLLKISNLLKK